MPRNRRINLPSSIYHVITRGHERRKIFIDKSDRVEFLKRLSENLKKTHCQCLAWVLMPNHIHLLIRNGSDPLSNFVHKVLTGYAIYFNHRHKRSGYLFQNRYKSILCQEDTYLLELVRYIHLNPLRALLVKDMRQLDCYPWSGHAVLLGNKSNDWQEKNEVLKRFGQSIQTAVKRYQSFINDGKTMRHSHDLSGGGLRRSAGGWTKVELLRKNKEYWRGDERILGDGDFVENMLKTAEEKVIKEEELKRKGWDIEKLADRVCKLLYVNPEALTRKGRNNPIQKAKDLVACWGVKELNLKRRELMRVLNISQPALSKAIQRGENFLKNTGLKLLS